MNKYTIALLIAISIALSLPQTVKANFGFNVYGYSGNAGLNFRQNNCFCRLVGYSNYSNYGYGQYYNQNYYSPMVGGYYMSPYQSFSRNVLDAVVFDRLARSSQTPSYSIRYNTDNRSNYNNRYIRDSYNQPYKSNIQFQDYSRPNINWQDRSIVNQFQSNINWSDEPTLVSSQSNIGWSDQ